MTATESFRAFADCLREPAILVSTSGDVLALNLHARGLLTAGGKLMIETRAALHELGGQIEVESRATTGTVFTLLLPVSDGHREAAGRSPESVTVLVVDDDDMTRDVIADSLMSAGFTVLSASDGETAIEIAHTHSEVDLLVTDVVMPRLTGPRVARRLRERLPRMRVL